MPAAPNQQKTTPPRISVRCLPTLAGFLLLHTYVFVQKKLLSVRGAPATSETLAKCASAMHDADLLIETARSEMEKGLDQSGAAASTPTF